MSSVFVPIFVVKSLIITCGYMYRVASMLSYPHTEVNASRWEERVLIGEGQSCDPINKSFDIFDDLVSFSSRSSS